MNNNRTWEALSMKDRASFIKLAMQNGYRDLNSIRNLYNDRMKLLDRIDSTSNADFVKRIQDPNREVLRNPDGTVSTHELAWRDDGKGNAVVYPTVQSTSRGLQRFEDPEAYERAIKNRDTLQMTSSEADWYTKNYKRYAPEFNKYATGGPKTSKYDSLFDPVQSRDNTGWTLGNNFRIRSTDENNQLVELEPVTVTLKNNAENQFIESEPVTITGKRPTPFYLRNASPYYDTSGLKSWTNKIMNGEATLNDIPVPMRTAVGNYLLGEQAGRDMRIGRDQNYGGLAMAMNLAPFTPMIAPALESITPALGRGVSKGMQLYNKFIPKPIRQGIKGLWEVYSTYDTFANLGNRVETIKDDFSKGKILSGLGNSALVGLDLAGTAGGLYDGYKLYNNYKRLNRMQEWYTGVSPYSEVGSNITKADNFPKYNGTIWTSNNPDYARFFAKSREDGIFKVLVDPSQLRTISAPKASSNGVFIWDRLPYRYDGKEITMFDDTFTKQYYATVNYKDGHSIQGDYAPDFGIEPEVENVTLLPDGPIFSTKDQALAYKRQYYDKGEINYINGKRHDVNPPEWEEFVFTHRLNPILSNTSYKTDDVVKQVFDTKKYNNVRLFDVMDDYLLDKGTGKQYRIPVNESILAPHTPHIVLPYEKSKWSLLFDNLDDITVKALGGPLYNEDNPIEAFQGNPYIPVVRYDEGGFKIKKGYTGYGTNLYNATVPDNMSILPTKPATPFILGPQAFNPIPFIYNPEVFNLRPISYFDHVDIERTGEIPHNVSMEGVQDITEDVNNGAYYLYPESRDPFYKNDQIVLFDGRYYRISDRSYYDGMKLAPLDLSNFTHWGISDFRNQVLPKRDYIGSDAKNNKDRNFETRTKVIQRVPNMIDDVYSLSEQYGIDPNVLFNRLYHEGILDHFASTYNELNTVDQSSYWDKIKDKTFNGFEHFGLDNTVRLIQDGLVKPQRDIPFDVEMNINEKDEEVLSPVNISLYDALELKAAELQYRQEVLKKRGVNDADMSTWLNAAYNLGLYHKDLEDRQYIINNYTVPNYNFLQK